MDKEKIDIDKLTNSPVKSWVKFDVSKGKVIESYNISNVTKKSIGCYEIIPPIATSNEISCEIDKLIRK